MRISQNPNQNNEQLLNPLIDRMPIVDPKIDPMQPQYRSNMSNVNQISNATNLVNPNENDNMNGEINMQNEPNVLHKSNIPQVESKCGIAQQIKEAQNPSCGIKGKKNAYLEVSEQSKRPERSERSEQSSTPKRKDKKSRKDKKDKKDKMARKLVDDKSYYKSYNKKRDKKKHSKHKKSKRSKRSKRLKREEKIPRRDRHEEEILNIFERELAITNGSIQRERQNKESKFRTNIMENQDTYDGPSALNTFSDNFMAF